MSDHEDHTFDTGYSTPVPELDDHRHQSASIQKSQSRRGTVDTVHSVNFRAGQRPELSLVNRGLLHTGARDFEEAVMDDEDDTGISPGADRHGGNGRGRRGTVDTIDPRSISPPNSVKAFADARHRERERELSASDPSSVKAFAEARRQDDYDLRRTISGASHRSGRSRLFTRNDDAKSFVGSVKSEAEEDVCFPLHAIGNKNNLQIDFEALEDFIAEEAAREKTQPQTRVFPDLRKPKATHPSTVATADGDFTQVISDDYSSLSEKEAETVLDEHAEPNINGNDINRFEFFSTQGEATIHAAEFGDLILPGEAVSNLFTFPPGEEEEEGVWWLNMNNPTEDEIRAICKAFGVHPLTIEDIGTQESREKIELFPSYYFACFRSFHVKQIDKGQQYEPFNIYVVVFREGTLSFSFYPNPHAGQVRKRITMLKDYVALSSDWICYALIDDIVDSFAPVITRIEHETDSIEDGVFVARQDDMHFFLQRIGMVRKNVMGLMKLLGGKADVLKGFTKRCNANYKVTPRMDIGLYLGDIQDHVVTMMTSLAHFEKMLSRSHSNYLAQLSINNIAQGTYVNKVLSKITLLASILVPLNLVCGLFGMNVTVPWEQSGSLGPFFGIFGFLIFFTCASLGLARRMRFI
ncbi:putative metal ion transporter C27B12.12c [Venustampulla echinocandica]|uniref:Putative metal ion transporter C27B12.12c n=1 Tax=Venustampulla echinocandica TaxID=2656787 RepID=A0A370TIH8_9HELO|nr:putative metal ion transporter C27B12.12c [Venustampulla echinocandica]RDL35164.1 putative metal ion transporter C27B12.12c [Venustampulla echinocandica]